MTLKHDAFELGMHSAFKKAGVQTQEQAAFLLKIAGEMITQHRANRMSLAAYELGLRKTAADHGLLTTEEQDAFVMAAQKVASEKHQKVATIGAIIGALRKKDPGESRTHSVLRSAGTDLATTLGGTVGANVGGVGGLLGGAALGGRRGSDVVRGGMGDAAAIREAIKRLGLLGGGAAAGAVGLGTLGAVGAYNLAKRKPLTTGEKVKGNVKDLKKKVMHLLGK